MYKMLGPGNVYTKENEMEPLKFKIISAMVTEADETITVAKIKIFSNHGSCLLKLSVKSGKNPFVRVHEILTGKIGIAWKLIQRFGEIPEKAILQAVFEFLADNNRIRRIK